MPGIVGIISRNSRGKNEKDLRRMLDCMMHEPFNNSGIYINEQLGLYAGWVCHKDSFSDCMPVTNEKKDLVLIFAGENFADKLVIDELKRKGHEFDDSNASYLIHLYEDQGEEFLQHLNGWFSGILVDLRKKKMIIFNDRYGMQRIYFHEHGEEFLFASEAKSLLKIRPELRKIDMKSLGEFHACDCVLENRSLFSGISVLPGASSWTFDNSGTVTKDYYFRPGIWEDQPVLEKEEFYEKLKETFLHILPRYFRAKQPIALSLTSGLDTRKIMSCIDTGSYEFPCYTFGGMHGDTLDIKIARKIAAACDKQHEVIRLNGNFLSDLPNLANKTIYRTDGCHDVCGSHDIYLNERAREIAPVRITGKFGSEILGNHSMFKKPVSLSSELFHPEFRKYVDEAIRTFHEMRKGHKLSFAIFKEMSWHEYGRLAMEQSVLTLRTPYMDNDLVKLMYQAPAEARESKELRLRLIQDNNPTLRKIMTDRGTAGTYGPLLSKFAQLFYYSLVKSEYMYLYQMPPWMVKIDRALAPLHPEKAFLGRFQFVHYPIWFRNEMSDYVKEILLDKRTSDRPYLNKEFLGKMVHGHLQRDYSYIDEINKTLTAELIQRLLIENV